MAVCGSWLLGLGFLCSHQASPWFSEHFIRVGNRSYALSYVLLPGYLFFVVRNFLMLLRHMHARVLLDFPYPNPLQSHGGSCDSPSSEVPVSCGISSRSVYRWFGKLIELRKLIDGIQHG